MQAARALQKANMRLISSHASSYVATALEVLIRKTSSDLLLLNGALKDGSLFNQPALCSEASYWYGLFDILHKRSSESWLLCHSDQILVDTEKLRTTLISNERERNKKIADTISQAVKAGLSVLFLSSNEQSIEAVIQSVNHQLRAPIPLTVHYKYRDSRLDEKLSALKEIGLAKEELERAIKLASELLELKKARHMRLFEHYSSSELTGLKELEVSIAEKLAEQEQTTAALGVSPSHYKRARSSIDAEIDRQLKLLRISDYENQELECFLTNGALVLASCPKDFLRSGKLRSLKFDMVILDNCEATTIPLAAFYFFASVSDNLYIFTDQTTRAKSRIGPCDQSSVWLNRSIFDWQSDYFSENPMVADTVLTDEKVFWELFITDIENAEEEILIVSPYVFPGRLHQLQPYLSAALARSVRIRLIIGHKPQGDYATPDQVQNDLKQHGFEVNIQPSIHYKTAVIDGRISWEGSLNILSHSNTKEHMRRFFGKGIATEILNNLNLRLTVF